MTLPYNATVVYSTRRTLALCITKNAELVVRAPRKTSENQIVDMILTHTAWIEKNLLKMQERLCSEPELTEKKICELRSAAKEELPKLTRHYADIMGLSYGRITITSAETRFGSCSSKGNISYSYRLMRYPRAAIEYVVVHELCHLVEMNHSKRFYALVASVLPDYKERKQLLK